MITVKTVVQSRSIKGGHAIELDLELDDGSIHTIECPYERIPFLMHAITNAAAMAETTQKASAGDRLNEVIVPYRATDMRTGVSGDGPTVVAEFATSFGPVQVAMPPALARKTIERLSNELALLGTQQFLKPS